jgi:hypothetical protein
VVDWRKQRERRGKEMKIKSERKKTVNQNIMKKVMKRRNKYYSRKRPLLLVL